jgi:hypothetical protein
MTKQGGVWGRIATAVRRVLRSGLGTDRRGAETTVEGAPIATTAPVPMLHRASDFRRRRLRQRMRNPLFALHYLWTRWRLR